MTAAIGTEITNGVLTALRTIDPANGYRTDAGARVYRARTDHLDDSATNDYPAIVVHTLRDAAESRTGRQSLQSREIQIQGVTHTVTATEAGDEVLLDYEPILDDLAEDIHRALLPLTDRDALEGRATSVAISGAEYEPPPEGSLLISVSFTVTINYVYKRT